MLLFALLLCANFFLGGFSHWLWALLRRKARLARFNKPQYVRYRKCLLTKQTREMRRLYLRHTERKTNIALRRRRHDIRRVMDDYTA